MLTQVLSQLLNSDSATSITALLGTHGGFPAIFTGGVPKNAPDMAGATLPFIVITPERSESGEWGTRAKRGAVCAARVQIVNPKSYSRANLLDLAMKIWALINRHSLEPYMGTAGFENWGCVAELPQNAPDSLGFPGLAILVRAHVLEKTA